MRRIPPSARLSLLSEELRQRNDVPDLTSELFRLGGRKILQELMEAETTERLGREPYERRRDATPGYRNGYKARKVRTAEGVIEVDVPQVRGAEEPFSPAIWEALRRRTDVLDRLAVEMYARGLSTRDIEEALREATGDEMVISRSSVSRVTETLWDDFEAFAERDLSGLDVVYLFLDAVYESLREQVGLKEGILASWGILSDGSKVLIHLSLGNKESYEGWLDHLRDLVRRGLKTPLTVTTDGAPGLIKAVESLWPETERVRCWAHKMRNVLDKVPDEARPALKPYLEAVRDAPDYETGRALAADVTNRFGRDCPSAMRSFTEDLDASLAHLRLPPAHRKHVRTTNLIERSFEEERRRARAVPRFRTEKECLKLVFATLWRASERWRRIRFSEHERRQLQHYREQREQRRQKATQREETTATVA